MLRLCEDVDNTGFLLGSREGGCYCTALLGWHVSPVRFYREELAELVRAYLVVRVCSFVTWRPQALGCPCRKAAKRWESSTLRAREESVNKDALGWIGSR